MERRGVLIFHRDEVCRSFLPSPGRLRQFERARWSAPAEDGP